MASRVEAPLYVQAEAISAGGDETGNEVQGELPAGGFESKQYVYQDGESKDGGVVRDGSVPPSVGEDDPPSQPSPPPHVGQARRRDWRPTCSFLACIRQSCIGIHTFIVFIKARRRVRRDCIQNRIDPG